MFPKLEGPLSTRMTFKGRKMLIWSLNDYLGLGNHPEVRATDTEATQKWGLAYPMGSRMLTGNTDYHEALEGQLADFVDKEAALLVNYGYQAVFSIIDALVDRKDVIVYDSESHASIVDGVRLHIGKRFVYQHNDIESLQQQLERAEKITKETGGGILVITEGVFGMRGDLGCLQEIVALKSDYNFRLFVDDAHGFGVMGKQGSGIMEEFNISKQVDLYFATFAKAMACIGGFVAGSKEVIRFLRYNLRSQIFAKSLPLPIVIGAQKRLDLLRTHPEYRAQLWETALALQSGFCDHGFDIGKTKSPITPVYLKSGDIQSYNLILDMRINYNIFCSGVIFPVVPRNVILLRMIPTASHTLADVQETIDCFIQIKEKLANKIYASMQPEDMKMLISN